MPSVSRVDLEHASEITFLQPTSAVPELLRSGVLEDGLTVWSMWPGYLKESGGRSLLLRSSHLASRVLSNTPRGMRQSRTCSGWWQRSIL